MLRHSTVFKSTLPSSIRPAGSPISLQNFVVTTRKRVTVIPFGKKSPEEAMEAPIPAGTSIGAGAPTKESGDGADSGLLRNDSIPVSKRSDGLGGFDVSSSPMRVFPLCCVSLTSFATLSKIFPFQQNAEYLKIENIRDKLTPRESPFVSDNNAGGGFGMFEHIYSLPFLKCFRTAA